MGIKTTTIAVVLILSSHYSVFYWGQKYANHIWELKWLARDIEELELSKKQQAKIDEVTIDAEKRIAQIRADAIAADNAAYSLRQTVANLRKRLNSTTAAASKTERDSANMLADLFESADKRAGELAKIADEARKRGLICEKSYDAIKLR